MSRFSFLRRSSIFLAALALALGLGTPGGRAADTAKDRTLNVLFIGNSFTSRHNLSHLIKSMAESADPHLHFEVTTVIYGGRTLADHWKFGSQNFVSIATLTDQQEAATLASLRAQVAAQPDNKYVPTALAKHEELAKSIDRQRRKWDIVVLQSFRDDLAGDKSSYCEYAPKFAALAKAIGAQVILYETTLDTQNERPLTAAPDPAPIQAKARMIAALADRLGAKAVPMSSVALRSQTVRPDLTLRYINDGHLNQTMAYLTACTFYAVLFDRSPVGLTIDTVTDTRSGVGHGDQDRDGGPLKRTFNAKERAELQQIAWDGLQWFRHNAETKTPATLAGAAK